MAKKKNKWSSVYRTLKVPMPHLADTEFAKLCYLRCDAAELWAGLVAYHRMVRKDRQPWPSMQDLARQMTGQTHLLGLSLGTQSQCLIFDEFLGVVSAASENRKNGKAAGGASNATYPWRTRPARDTPWDRRDVRDIPGKGLVFSLAKTADDSTRSGLARQAPLLVPYHDGIPKNCSSITIHYDVSAARFFLLFKIREKAKALPKHCRQAIGIDLGQIRLAVAVTEDGQSVNIKGRGLRHVRQGHNRKKAWRSGHIARQCKGSHRRQKEIAKQRRERRRVADQVANILHTTTRRLVDFAVAHEVGIIYVGDAGGVRQSDCGRRQNQANSDWPTAVLEHQLTYKAALQGLKVEPLNEAYTTRTCPRCGEVKTTGVSGRAYECAVCDLRAHRDLVGAWNIMVRGTSKSSGPRPGLWDQTVASATNMHLTPTGVRGVRRSPAPRLPVWSSAGAAQRRSPAKHAGEARGSGQPARRGTSPPVGHARGQNTERCSAL